MFWLLVWQAASLAVGNPILLCGPLDVIAVLASDIASASFWLTVSHSFSRIFCGFIAAFAAGAALGVLAWRSLAFAALFNPFVQFIKSVPIACFIVLLLIWFGSAHVGTSAVFLVAFPAFYFSMTEGLGTKDVRIEEMLDLFRVGLLRKALVFHWQTVLPFLVATSRTAVGMSWKAGVAAELIGLSVGSIGERIYQAKISLSSADLLAWTLVIVAISMACERLFLAVLARSGSWAWSLALFRNEAKRHADMRDGGQEDRRKRRSLVKLVDASKSFADGTGVGCVSLDVASGDRLALRGPSGAGKTTVLRMLAGLEKPDSGMVESEAVVSMVFQEARLFEDRSAIDNVSLATGGSIGRQAIEEMLDEVLPRSASSKPVSQLSGGMRRRVELVRALAAKSDLVLLDEPFSGLDEETQSVAQRFTLAHQKGRALLIASHDGRDFEALGIEAGISLGLEQHTKGLSAQPGGSENRTGSIKAEPKISTIR